MYLLSYRGPSAAGGISSSLNALWSHPKASTLGWWHMAESGLVYNSGIKRPGVLASFPQEDIDRHYKFCNEFIWPLVHSFPDEVMFDAENCQSYTSLQDALLKELSKHQNRDIFVHDYQFGMVPQELPNCNFFWHIPWPFSVPAVWKPFLRKLAVHIAGARKIGFHTKEYADNFLACLDDRMTTNSSKVVVAPLPIDSELWEARAEERESALPKQFAAIGTPYVVSVDRTDYTKGILNRLGAITAFFEQNPECIGKITFVQVCQRSRSGIEAFDRYWQRCRLAHDRLNRRWGTGDWQPSVWIDPVFSGDQLAAIYKHAKALLITSMADGLNLTAKEFVACQSGQAGSLILSKKAGAWQQLSPHAFDFDPTDEQECAAAIATALFSPTHERRMRLENMREVIRSESLLDWAEQFSMTQRRAAVPRLLSAAGR